MGFWGFLFFVILVYFVVKAASSGSKSPVPAGAALGRSQEDMAKEFEMRLKDIFPPLAKSRLVEEFPTLAEHFTTGLLSDYLSASMKNVIRESGCKSFLELMQQEVQVKEDDEADAQDFLNEAPAPVAAYIAEDPANRMKKLKRALRSAFEGTAIQAGKEMGLL